MDVLIVLKNLLENCLEKTIDLFVPVGRQGWKIIKTPAPIVNFFIHPKTDPFDLWILGLFCQGGM